MIAEQIDVPAVTPISVGVPMMTAGEAESCLSKIKAGIHDIRALALDLREREGWRALGHKSWRACVKAEFDTSIATLYRQLRAAEIDRDVSQVETSPVRLPTVQAEELARLPDAGSRQAAYLAAKQATGGSLTQAAIRDAVDRTTKPSVRSERDASDNQAFPEDNADLGFDPGSDDLGAAESQEPFGRPSKFCSTCGPFTGEQCDCPPVVAGGSVPVEKIRQAIADGRVKDGAEVAMDVPAICPAMPFDGNTNMQILRALHGAGLISSDDPWETPHWTLTTRSAPAPVQVDAETPADPVPSPELIAEDAMDYSPLLREYDSRMTAALDLTSLDMGAVAGVLSPDQRNEARGDSDRLRAWLDHFGIAIFDAQRGRPPTTPVDASPSVRKSVAQIEAEIPDDVTPGELVTLALRALKRVDLASFIRFESQVPMIRKEIGAREREAAKAAV
jgi:hypothetical protein